MESEKKKIKVKANVDLKKQPLLLSKKYLFSQSREVLVLNKELKENKNLNKQVRIISNKIIKLSEEPNNQIPNQILNIENISKNLGGKPIIKNMSFSMNKNHIVGLLGPNGSGKSTLFNLIIGKISPDSGQINFLNKNINNFPIHQRATQGISLLEQHKGLFGNMTAYENLYAILELHTKDKNKIDAKIMQLLSFFKLEYLSNVKASHMSGGEYKKISTLQRVCNKDIKLLLLDEPMAALDPISINSIKKFILELKSLGLSIIITDHNFYAIHDILDECKIIRDGALIKEGKPREIIKDEKVIKYYLGEKFKI